MRNILLLSFSIFLAINVDAQSLGVFDSTAFESFPPEFFITNAKNDSLILNALKSRFGEYQGFSLIIVDRGRQLRGILLSYSDHRPVVTPFYDFKGVHFKKSFLLNPRSHGAIAEDSIEAAFHGNFVYHPSDVIVSHDMYFSFLLLHNNIIIDKKTMSGSVLFSNTYSQLRVIFDDLRCFNECSFPEFRCKCPH